MILVFPINNFIKKHKYVSIVNSPKNETRSIFDGLDQ